MNLNVARVSFAGYSKADNEKLQEDWRIAHQAVQVLGSGLNTYGIPNSATEIMQKHRDKLPMLKEKVGQTASAAAAYASYTS